MMLIIAFEYHGRHINHLCWKVIASGTRWQQIDMAHENEAPISSPGKVLFPEDGITKADLADYYRRIAPYLLPFLQDRPLTLRHFPRGIEQEGFYHKHAADYYPDFLERLRVPMRSKGGEEMEMIMADEVADLVYLAGQNVIELHIGLSQAAALDKPDQLIFDLDPADNDFAKVRQTALALKELLDEHQLASFVKTTGSRGLHIHVPVRTERPFAEAKKVARRIAEQLHDQHPELTTLEHRKEKRGDKVFIDYLRNDYGMTAIAPYALRARRHAPVATPIEWSELEKSDLGAQSYHLGNIFRRLGQKDPLPWHDFAAHRVSWEQLPD